MKTKLFFPVLCSIFTSHAVFAQNSAHYLGLAMGFGDVDMKMDGTAIQLVDPAAATIRLDYSYTLTPEWQINLHYLNTDSDDFTLLFDDFLTDQDFKSSSITLSARYHLPLSTRNKLFIQAGANLYDSEILGLDSAKHSDSGLGLAAGIGWEYRFDNDFAINFGYYYYGQGDADVVAVNLGAGLYF